MLDLGSCTHNICDLSSSVSAICMFKWNDNLYVYSQYKNEIVIIDKYNHVTTKQFANGCASPYAGFTDDGKLHLVSNEYVVYRYDLDALDDVPVEIKIPQHSMLRGTVYIFQLIYNKKIYVFGKTLMEFCLNTYNTRLVSNLRLSVHFIPKALCHDNQDTIYILSCKQAEHELYIHSYDTITEKTMSIGKIKYDANLSLHYLITMTMHYHNKSLYIYFDESDSEYIEYDLGEHRGVIHKVKKNIYIASNIVTRGNHIYAVGFLNRVRKLVMYPIKKTIMNMTDDFSDIDIVTIDDE